MPDLEHSPQRFLRHGRTLLGWWAANLACECFGWRYPNQYKRVRYEDLALATEDVIQGIFAELGLGTVPKLSGGATAENRHQLFGSRVRFNPPLPSEIRSDTRWKTEMKPLDRWMISALSWPLRWRYGY